jgi:hypothetical protein
MSGRAAELPRRLCVAAKARGLIDVAGIPYGPRG